MYFIDDFIDVYHLSCLTGGDLNIKWKWSPYFLIDLDSTSFP